VAGQGEQVISRLVTKDEMLEVYKAYAVWMYMQHGVWIKQLWSDCGGKDTGNKFSKFLVEQGMEWRLTTHDMPQHNGVAESLNHRIMECVHACLIQSGLPKSLWVEAANFIIWVKNHTITKVLGDVTLHKKLTRQKPSLAGVPEWGQRVWVHRRDGLKLEACTWPACWVRFDARSTHAHHIYWPSICSITMERDIRFTIDFTTVYTSAPPLGRVGQALAPAAPSAPTQAPPAPTPIALAVAQQLALQKPAALPPPATSSSEEEVKVEDKLDDEVVGPVTPKRHKGKGPARPGVQAA